MERMVISELDSYKQELKEILKQKFSDKLDDKDIDFTLTILDDFAKGLVNTMKEGKSAHEKFFSDIILNSPDAIIGYDKNDSIFLWNNGAVSLFDYQKDEVFGKKYTIIIPDFVRERDLDFFSRKMKADGYYTNYETECISKGGEIKNVSISSYKILSDKQEYIGKVSIIRDITREKNLQKELHDKENLALIGTVVSTIAHNLSNPLNIISGNADYLLLDRKENEEGYEELQIIVQEITRITKSIRQILNFSKPVILTKEKCNINEIITEIISNAHYISNEEKKSISFKSNLDKSLGEIYLDKDQIKDVILNILNNAIQSIKTKGTIKVQTSMSQKKNVNYAIIKIEDSGCGIKKEDLKNIFIPFFSTKEYGKGTGLGLAFANRVVKEHNGFIDVKSDINKGTTFYIYLPI